MKTLKIIAGRTGSGRSRSLINMLRALSEAQAKRQSDEKLLLIVPEQFTFETERTLATELASGLNVSVLSFTSLARRVLAKTGERRIFLSEQGRRMAIRRALMDAKTKGELGFFGRVASHAGFAGECDKLFTMLKRAGITSQMLKDACAALQSGEPDGMQTGGGAPFSEASGAYYDGGLLKNKLFDLALIYERVTLALEGYIDGEDAFGVLCENLPKSEYASAHIFIDGFDLISSRLYAVIGALMDVSLSMTVALRLDLSENCRDGEVFLAEKKLLGQLERIAFEHGVDVELTRLTGTAKKYQNEALAHLEREAFAYPYYPYRGEFNAENAIVLTAAHEPMNEAEVAAEDIARLIRCGKRYRDIAIIATDMNAYMNAVSRALSARNIPFFTDAKHPLSSYCAPRLVLDALYACARGFSGVVDILKTGLSGVSRTDAERLENYALRRGARSLAREITDDDSQTLESARLTLMEPLFTLRERLSGSGSVQKKVEAIYAYIVELNVRDKLVERANELKRDGRLELMEETSQLYEMTMELFSQLHSIMGDEETSNLRFAQMVEEGFDAYEVGVIPTGADQVLFGSIGRTKAKDVDVVFILGASEGAFPTSVSDDTVINDSEVSRLCELGLDGWQSSAELNLKELSDAYGAATKPREKLYMSYSAGSDGISPCGLYLRLRDIFFLTERNDITYSCAQTKETGFLQLTRALRAYWDTGRTNGANAALPNENDAAALYSYFAKSDEYSERFKLILSALDAKSSPSPLPQALARRLYRVQSSLGCGVTQLEAYNACPFKHFARYALRAQPRKEYRERHVDEGIFAHEAMRRFSDRLIALGEGVNRLTEADCSDILDDLLPDLISTHNDGILCDSARMRAAQRRLVKLIKTAAWVVVRQLQAGQFSLEATEASFGRGGAYPPITLDLDCGVTLVITGVIDRVDSADTPNGKCIRIVDYKTGGTYFDYLELYNGLKIQLPLYLEAALSANRAAKAAGIYYLPIKQPRLDLGADAAAFEKALYKHFRLSGLTLSETEIKLLNSNEATLKDTVTASKNYLVSDAELALTRAHALTKAKEAATAALLGHADVSPYKKDKRSACDYCDYNDICRFDGNLEDCRYRLLSKLDRDRFFASLTKGGGENGMDS